MSLESTLQYVGMVTRYMPGSRRGRVPRGTPSRLLESDYAARLVEWVESLAEDLRPLAGTIGEPGLRMDESPHGARVRGRIEPVRRKAGRDIHRLEPDIERAGRTTAAAHRQTLDRQTRAALGVEVPTTDQRIPGIIDRFVSKNLTRIRTLTDRMIGEVEAIVIDAWDRGLSESEVAEAIEARIGVAKSHARFMARDQMGALYTQVQRARHQEIGVRLFRWQTQGDSKVRDSHRVKHGRVFPYEGSRAPSFFPGDEYGCRCFEEPVFDEIKAKLFAGKGRTRT